MTKLICTFILFYINILCYGQSKFPFDLLIHEQANWEVKIDTIPASEFDNSKLSDLKYLTILNQHDSILKFKIREFPKTMMKKDSCLVLKGVDRDLNLCAKKPYNDRLWTDYRLFNIEEQFLVFEQAGYESQSFITFNPTTSEYFITNHYPIFINDNFVYSFGNYYGEGQIQIVDNKNNKYFGLETFNWQLKRFFKSDNSFIIEFISNDLARQKKYLRLAYN